MSIDLQGWFIKTHPGESYEKARYELEVIGANHSWSYSAVGHTDEDGNFIPTHVYHDGSGPQWYDADKTHTFMEQVEAVIEDCKDFDEDIIESFKEEAKRLENMSKQLGKPIVSYWL